MVLLPFLQLVTAWCSWTHQTVAILHFYFVLGIIVHYKSY